MRQNDQCVIGDKRVALMECTRGLLMDLLRDDPEIDLHGLSEESLLDELGVDSLTYLDLFVRLKERFRFEADIHAIVRYIRDHDVRSLGDLLTRIVTFIEIQQESGQPMPACA